MTCLNDHVPVSASNYQQIETFPSHLVEKNAWNDVRHEASKVTTVQCSLNSLFEAFQNSALEHLKSNSYFKVDSIVRINLYKRHYVRIYIKVEGSQRTVDIYIN